MIVCNQVLRNKLVFVNNLKQKYKIKCRKQIKVKMMSKAERKVEFKNASNEKLVGIFNEAGLNGVVILCHGYTSGKNKFIFPQMAEAFAKKKISSLR